MNFQKIEPRHTFKDLMFSPEVEDSINDMMLDQKYRIPLSKEGIPVRRRLFLHGPSGCGKTSIAHALAAGMDLPVYEISIGQMVDSHLGGTAKNIEEAIKFYSQNPCVFLMDEFDSIGSARSSGGRQSEGEMNRAVNSLLVGLESNQPAGILVACTNMMEAIDRALMRRFDMILEVKAPPRETLVKIAVTVLKGRFGIDPAEMVRGLSTPAEVTTRCFDKLRREVINQCCGTMEFEFGKQRGERVPLKKSLPRATISQRVN